MIPEDSGFGFGVAPRYYDYQARADYVPNERFNLRLLAFGSDDLFSFVFEELLDHDPSFDGFSFGRAFHQIQGTLNYTIDSETDLFAGLMSGWQNIDIRPGGIDRHLLCPLVLRVTSRTAASTPEAPHRHPGDPSTLRGLRFDPRPDQRRTGAASSREPRVIEATEIGYTGELGLWPRPSGDPSRTSTSSAASASTAGSGPSVISRSIQGSP